ncbi:DUF2815 family protein [Bacteroides sedimenti]|uniref:DUF2815 family protein n=1 Tax=Bacteroides sedimenti TaxID=2136147 RepID=A0ABN6Z1W6_9BACE
MAKVVTGKVRFSYAHVFTPHAIEEGQEPKYSVSIIIPKKDKKTIAKIREEIEKLTKEFLQAKGLTKLPAKFYIPLRDGDEEREDDPAYANSMFLGASSKRKPQIVDDSVQPIIDSDEFYSGCYGRASINLFLFDKAGNKGIGVGLNNLQKLEDGERLGGGSTAEEDFGSEDSDW